MKKLLLVVAGLAVVLALTNPSTTQHQQAVADDLRGRFVQSSAAISALDLEQTVSSKVYSRNLLVCSLTVIRYPETTVKLERTVGIGLLGKVFLWSGM